MKFKIKQRNFSLFFDKSFSKGFWKQVGWLILIMVAVYLFLILLSYNDFFYFPGAEESKGRWYDILFLLIDPGTTNEGLRNPFALLVAILGMAVFSGMLISVISNLLQRRVEGYIEGSTNYSVSHHVIVLGFNRSIPSLLKRLNKKYPKSYILLMCNRDSSETREWVHANVDNRIENRVIVLNGERDAIDDLRRLSLHRTPEEIYVLGEENETGHDEISLTCVKRMSELMGTKMKVKVPCYVQIDSSSMFTILQQADFVKIEKVENLILHPFNFNEIWSQKVLSLTSFHGIDYLPIDGKGIGAESKKHVHLIIFGLNAMGRTLAVNAAHVLHFPNFKEGDFSTYTRITFIDPDAIRLGEQFRNRYSTLFQLSRYKTGEIWTDPLADSESDSPYRYLGPLNFMDIEWEFIQGDVAMPKVRKYIEEVCSDSGSITTIALCGDDSDRNLAICMGLPQAIFESPSLNMMLVRQQNSDMGVKMIRSFPFRGEKLRAFGMMNECYSENLLTDDYGQVIDALYNELHGYPVDWENKKVEDRWSSNYSANMLFMKLRSLGVDEEKFKKNPKEYYEKEFERPEVKEWLQLLEHNRWVTEKILMGFRPLFESEQKDFGNSSSRIYNDDFAKKKKGLKLNKIHLDICSNADLSKYDPDPNIRDYDIEVNKLLWRLFEMTRQS